MHVGCLGSGLCMHAGVSKSFTEKMVGHKGYLDQAYFKPAVDQIVNEYRKAVPNLTIMEEVKYEQVRKRQLLDTARLLGFSEEKMKRLEEVLARTKSVDEAVTEFKKLRDPEISENSGVFINSNGYEAKVVDEASLIAYVERGWTW